LDGKPGVFQSLVAQQFERSRSEHRAEACIQALLAQADRGCERTQGGRVAHISDQPRVGLPDGGPFGGGQSRATTLFVL
jgi:hypothetical protein